MHKSFTCPQGHQWHITLCGEPPPVLQNIACPVCAGPPETRGAEGPVPQVLAEEATLPPRHTAAIGEGAEVAHPPPGNSSPVPPPVGDLLLRWEELRGRGRPTTAEELCGDFPEHLAEVRRRLTALEAVFGALDTAEPRIIGGGPLAGTQGGKAVPCPATRSWKNWAGVAWASFTRPAR